MSTLRYVSSSVYLFLIPHDLCFDSNFPSNQHKRHALHPAKMTTNMPADDSKPSLMPSQPTYTRNKNIPIHEQTLRDHLSIYFEQLTSINREARVATTGPDDDIGHLISRCDRKKSLAVSKPTIGSTRIESISKRQPAKRRSVHRKPEEQEKPPMQTYEEITSNLCDIHMILTHLVGIEMTQETGLRAQAEALEGFAFESVNRLADAALQIDMNTVLHRDFLEFHNLHVLVLKILLRDGPDPESQERRKALLEKIESKSRCDELIQTLEGLSIESQAGEDETAMESI